MYKVITTRNGKLIQSSSFGDYRMADYHFLLEAHRIDSLPEVTVTLQKEHVALKLFEAFTAWENPRLAELTAV